MKNVAKKFSFDCWITAYCNSVHDEYRRKNTADYIRIYDNTQIAVENQLTPLIRLSIEEHNSNNSTN